MNTDRLRGLVVCWERGMLVVQSPDTCSRHLRQSWLLESSLTMNVFGRWLQRGPGPQGRCDKRPENRDWVVTHITDESWILLLRAT